MQVVFKLTGNSLLSYLLSALARAPSQIGVGALPAANLSLFKG
jgi:hypothetical protein